MMELEEIEKTLGLEVEPFIRKYETTTDNFFESLNTPYDDKPLIYYFLTEDYTILYIGQSKQPRKRMEAHYRNVRKEGHWINKIKFVSYRKCDADILLKTEIKEIKKYNPKYNAPDAETKLELLEVDKKWREKERIEHLEWCRNWIIEDLENINEKYKTIKSKLHDKENELRLVNIELNPDYKQKTIIKSFKECNICTVKFIDDIDENYEYCPFCGYRLTLINNMEPK